MNHDNSRPAPAVGMAVGTRVLKLATRVLQPGPLLLEYTVQLLIMCVDLHTRVQGQP
jgi:hypothetical protein